MEAKEYEVFINNYRKEKDFAFKNSHHSPIPHEERHTFEKLNYFPPNINFRYVVKIIENKGNKQILQVYVTEDDQDYLFVPFTDQTSGKETYGAGRYAEIQKDHQGNYILDFNLAYSPFCAYNDNFSCAIPPKENRLQVRIPAGEKNYREY